MKTLLSLLLISMLAVPALAQDGMGISAEADFVDEFVFVDPGVLFDFYVVITDPSSTLIGGYECSLSFPGDQPIISNVTGPNGWLNFGSPTNHLVGFQTPLPAAPMTVVSTITALVPAAPFETLVVMGPSEPSSFDGAGPGYADGVDPNVLVLCDIPTDGVVGTITTEVLPVEASTLSGVKTLFR